jgi:hypothetical protein
MASRATLLVLLLAAGCARTTLSGSAVDLHGAADPISELDFWDVLAQQGAVSNHDALHALLLQFAGKSPGALAERLMEARRRGWIDPDATLEPNRTARAGWIARVVCIEANLRGGLTMRLVGASERYGLKELAHRGWLPEMAPHEVLSGLQLIALLSAAEDHMAGVPDRPEGSHR